MIIRIGVKGENFFKRLGTPSKKFGNLLSANSLKKKVNIGSYLIYGSRLSRQTSKHSFATLDGIQGRAIRLIGLAYRRNVPVLFLSYRYY